ncbi:unnamed protein product [Alopecurus aequalis]
MYSRVLSFGRPLAEVFSIRYIGGGVPRGTISVFDGKRGQTIYSNERDQTTSVSQNDNNVVQLLLTGPYRAISADGCVAIQLDLPGRCKDQITLDVYNKATKYDQAVTKVVNTSRDDVHAEVTYALLSNAVEAIVEVKLALEQDEPVYGKIIARSTLGNVLLFESNEENTCIRSSKGVTIIPLTRSVLAMPLTSSLTIEMDLHDHLNVEIVKGAQECKPDLDIEHVLHFPGKNGQVDVKITWSE